MLTMVHSKVTTKRIGAAREERMGISWIGWKPASWPCRLCASGRAEAVSLMLSADSQLLDGSLPAVATPHSRRYTLLSGVLKAWPVTRTSSFNALLSGLHLDFWTTAPRSPKRRHGNCYCPSRVCVRWVGWGGHFSEYHRGENGDLRDMLLLRFPWVHQSGPDTQLHLLFLCSSRYSYRKLLKVLRALCTE